MSRSLGKLPKLGRLEKMVKLGQGEITVAQNGKKNPDQLSVCGIFRPGIAIALPAFGNQLHCCPWQSRCLPLAISETHPL